MTKTMKTKCFWLFAAALIFTGCMSSKDGDFETASPGDGYADASVGGDGEGQEYAGKVTAGEWRDLDNWLFWSDLMTGQQADQYSGFSSYWGLYTNHRVAVRVTNDAGQPQQDVRVQLLRQNGAASATVYEARTDNRGEVNLWVGLTQWQETVDTTNLVLAVNGATQSAPVSVTNWGEAVKWNELTATVSRQANIDIAFIVDATGSMSDEISFLKADLTDIIAKVGNKHADANIRTAALFYRDEGDDYLTRVSDFSTDLKVTTAFIAKQQAGGGGDYPEAVHTALEVGLQQLSWRENNSIRLVFMLLDAPPHKQDNVLTSLHATIPQYAQRGIRIIPVAASGVDKNTEFFLRFMAMATDATYVFITNHSGIGGEHIEATVGEYQVELLNDLMVRLIDEYMQ